MEQEMHYIQAVYRAGSFSRAAEQLYLTQPALSIAVSKVERKIGQPIFFRRNPVELTDAGRLYIEKINQMEQLERELDTQIQDLSELRTGKLLIGATTYYCSYILAPILTEYMERYPGITVNFTESDPKTLKAMLRAGQIDMTFSSTLENENDFQRFTAFRDSVILAVPIGFPVNRNLRDYALTANDICQGRHLIPDCPSVPLAALSDTEFILLEQGFSLRERIENFFSEANLPLPHIRLEFKQFVTGFRLAATGMGATFIYDKVVRAEDTQLLYYRINSSGAMRSNDIVVKKNRYISKALAAFIELFADCWPRETFTPLP